MRLTGKLLLPLALSLVFGAWAYSWVQTHNFDPVLFRNPDTLTPTEVVKYHVYSIANGQFRKADRVASAALLKETAENSGILERTWLDAEAFIKIHTFQATVVDSQSADLVAVRVEMVYSYSDRLLTVVRFWKTEKDYKVSREASKWRVVSWSTNSSHLVTETPK